MAVGFPAITSAFLASLISVLFSPALPDSASSEQCCPDRWRRERQAAAPVPTISLSAKVCTECGRKVRFNSEIQQLEYCCFCSYLAELSLN